ncbi:hypothetical protein Pla22_16300 [Rubripirellula amarantea]|uniref:Uncharacterized protein n=1 Tax=Rubripirellula amarantea TaxID=2527999 RepID=A0A5C5WTJ6_9BACT|nr:hypothetical protein Pla22_16300 [Rubripirellula amarantea]
MTFNVGRIRDCENRIQRDFVEFAQLWSAVKEDWVDSRRERFEREHLTSIGPSLSRFSASLHDFLDTIHDANRDLDDHYARSD